MMKTILCSILFTLISTVSFAQLKMSANLQTNHLWRDGEVADGLVVTTDASVKPFDGNLSFGVWGGVNIYGTYKEFNYYCSYRAGGFKAMLMDTYNFADYATYNNEEFFNYKPSSTGRFLDATLTYRFGENFPVKVLWATVLFGRDRNSDNTANRYSTFCSVEYPIYNKDQWRVDATVGGAFSLNPMGESANFYGDKPGIVDITMKISRDVMIENYRLPVSLTMLWNPQSNKAYLQLAAQLFSF
ncbi:MAG: hypothetical protein SNF68_02490 [Rikenellaceae bacterium]